MNNPVKAILTSLAGALLLASPASAAIVVYDGLDIGASSTDPRPNSDAAAALFDATGTYGLVDFESAPVGSYTSLLIAPGVTLTGLDANGNNQEIRNVPFSSPESLYGYNTTAGGSNFAGIYGGTITFSFATAIDSFGGYFSGAQSPEFGTLTLTFFDGSNQTITFGEADPNGGLQFLGFTDAGAMISSITVNGYFDAFALDDVRYGVTSPSVPDTGSTILLLGLGVAGVLVWHRRGRRQIIA